ncbi:MAG: fumarylacetoacetate hydrolase family protein [Deltaproteobacteria bacterium]|jgi:2-keto-4-pentenoate hydratase/2-oxohepta-3-ene-1,7-dioic acid hydratase in catechol pathway|nr:fumarylacetoacetate hydrolase family protein [Deltaproteobacteria bacterium]MBW2531355.1 fumarylacetoacetate hydrolase family protein [Deltaproteobacteria bacterium]
MTRSYARLELADGRRAYAEIRRGSADLLDRAPWLGGQPTGETIAGVDDVGRSSSTRLLAPVEPSKVVCVGRNYRAHAAELGNPMPSEPLLFLKPPSSLLEPDGTLELPPPELSCRVEHEVELGLVIGRRVRRANESEAAEAIFGYTVVGDITARDLQRKDKTWTRGKCMDGFCPTGPVVVSGLETAELRVRCTVNGQPRQDGNTRDMAFSPAVIVAYTSGVMTLEPGDLIATGTPEGVGPLHGGDTLSMIIDGIGELLIDVRAAAEG